MWWQTTLKLNYFYCSVMKHFYYAQCSFFLTVSKCNLTVCAIWFCSASIFLPYTWHLIYPAVCCDKQRVPESQWLYTSGLYQTWLPISWQFCSSRRFVNNINNPEEIFRPFLVMTENNYTSKKKKACVSVHHILPRENTIRLYSHTSRG